MTKTCQYCGEEIEYMGSRTGWVMILSGDEGGTYDLCEDADKGKHRPHPDRIPNDTKIFVGNVYGWVMAQVGDEIHFSLPNSPQDLGNGTLRTVKIDRLRKVRGGYEVTR